MAKIVLQAEERQELGKGHSRRLRLRGMLPAVVYGHGQAAVPVSVTSKEVDQILHSETGHNTIFELRIGKNRKDVLIRDYQLDPVRGTLVHADFQTVAMDEKMTFDVPVQTVGISKGVKAGGILDVVLREIEVECLPADVPDHIQIDISEVDVGDSVRVEALQVDSSKVTILSDPDLVVLNLIPPHVEVEVEEVLEEEEMAEPELIKKGKAEEEGEEEKRAGE